MMELLLALLLERGIANIIVAAADDSVDQVEKQLEFANLDQQGCILADVLAHAINVSCASEKSRFKSFRSSQCLCECALCVFRMQTTSMSARS